MDGIANPQQADTGNDKLASLIIGADPTPGPKINANVDLNKLLDQVLALGFLNRKTEKNEIMVVVENYSNDEFKIQMKQAKIDSKTQGRWPVIGGFFDEEAGTFSTPDQTVLESGSNWIALGERQSIANAKAMVTLQPKSIADADNAVVIFVGSKNGGKPDVGYSPNQPMQPSESKPDSSYDMWKGAGIKEYTADDAKWPGTSGYTIQIVAESGATSEPAEIVIKINPITS